MKTCPSSSSRAPLCDLTVGSRHLFDYLLLNLVDGTACRPVERGAQDASWTAIDPNPVTMLCDLAEGRVTHLYRGSCPDDIEAPAPRDAECRDCRALNALTPSEPPAPRVASSTVVEVSDAGGR